LSGRIGIALAIVAVALTLGVPTASATARRPLPPGSTPSPIATMPCRPKTQAELAQALGERATVGPPTWKNHRYTCTYAYQSGSYTLSIQELSSWDQTFAYYRSFKHTMGQLRPLEDLGQGAYQTNNGDVVVRKDWKVLLVDVGHLPARFGVPATATRYIAVTVADVILGCWAGD
jgi:hypothetical protein